MERVTGAVDMDVMEKVDLDYIKKQFTTLQVTFFIACTNDEQWQDSTTQADDGIPLICIKLPYHTVKRMKKENGSL